MREGGKKEGEKKDTEDGDVGGDRERARARARAHAPHAREEPVVVVSFVSNRVDFVALQLEGLKTYLRSASSSCASLVLSVVY